MVGLDDALIAGSQVILGGASLYSILTSDSIKVSIILLTLIYGISFLKMARKNWAEPKTP